MMEAVFRFLVVLQRNIMNFTEVTRFNSQWEGYGVAQIGDGSPQISEVGMQPELHHTKEELATYLSKVVRRVDSGDVPAGHLGFTKWSTQDKAAGMAGRITHAEAA